MRAVTYDVRLPTYFLGKALGRRFPGLYWGPLSGVRCGEVPRPERRGDDWVLVAPTLAGVCGSDVAAICYKSSPALTPFSSFPTVPGHEVVGRVLEVGPAVPGLAVGDRVVVEPFLTCASRGQAVACDACRTGAYCLCHATDLGPMAPGMLMGACKDQGGGWAESLAAHRSQLFAVPDALTDDLAVLVEPLAVGAHAVLRRTPRPGSRVLVVGSGMMAFAVLVALRWYAGGLHVTHLTELPHQRDAGLALGADAAICLADGADPTGRVAELTGARRKKPLLGRDVLVGGFEATFDCVGSARTLQDAFTWTAARGSVVLVGAPGHLPGLDWTFVWARELSVVGTLGYGVESWEGEAVRTFDLVIRQLLARPDAHDALRSLVTHRFPLEAYGAALRANLDRRASRALKTTFEPGRSA